MFQSLLKYFVLFHLVSFISSFLSPTEAPGKHSCFIRRTRTLWRPCFSSGSALRESGSQLNKSLMSLELGNFSFKKPVLTLGDLQGKPFTDPNFTTRGPRVRICMSCCSTVSVSQLDKHLDRFRATSF